ncbi:DUF6282 family protein [Sporolactobacillus sp. CQH2019]
MLHGVIDLHVHTFPDVVPRRNTDLELSRIYRACFTNRLFGFSSEFNP